MMPFAQALRDSIDKAGLCSTRWYHRRRLARYRLTSFNRPRVDQPMIGFSLFTVKMESQLRAQGTTQSGNTVWTKGPSIAKYTAEKFSEAFCRRPGAAAALG